MSQGVKAWYYAKGGKQQGPMSVEQLRGLTASGQVGPEDLVWADGMAEWVAARTISSLAPDTGVPQTMGYAPPLQYQSPSFDVVYGGFWLRVVAAILDQLILVGVGMLTGGIIGFIAGLTGNGPNSQAWPAVTVVIQLVGLVIGWLYFALQESGPKQATLGKRALGIKVTDLSGQPISFGRATGRHFGKIVSGLILGIGFIMAAFTQRKQGLHDMMAGTLVVKGKSQQG